jgi:hypothetical protein
MNSNPKPYESLQLNVSEFLMSLSTALSEKKQIISVWVINIKGLARRFYGNCALSKPVFHSQGMFCLYWKEYISLLQFSKAFFGVSYEWNNKKGRMERISRTGYKATYTGVTKLIIMQSLMMGFTHMFLVTKEPFSRQIISMGLLSFFLLMTIVRIHQSYSKNVDSTISFINGIMKYESSTVFTGNECLNMGDNNLK